jgi:flavin-dependent dehydrogenase
MNSTSRAVVVGASVGGLLAARALSETFGQVTVIDRDQLPEEPAMRRGVPQARHPHGLLASGTRSLEELFPRFMAEMVGRGALRVADMQSDIHWYNNGHLLNPEPSGIHGLCASRPCSGENAVSAKRPATL